MQTKNSFSVPALQSALRPSARPIKLSTPGLAVLATLLGLGTASISPAGTLYWDSDLAGTGNVVTTGAGLGGAGSWDTSVLNWWPGSGVTDQAWVNGNNDTAAFSGTAGAVTLTANIAVGGLLFNTTGYTLNTGANTLTFGAADNALTLNNIAAATITGAVTGTGNVTLTGGGNTAGVLALNGTSTTGWSGTTTIYSGMTLALAGNNQALVSTTGINLNGGGITLTNTTSGEAALDRVANTAGITSNGGTLTVTNTNLASTAYAETVGAVALTSGQLNVISTNNNAAGTSQTLTLSGLTHTGSTNTSTVAFGGGSLGGVSTIKNQILITGQSNTASGQIIGPWATIGSSAALQIDYAAYNRNGSTTNGFGVQGAGIGNSAETAWTNSANAYTNTTLGTTTLTGARAMTAWRYSNAAAGTLALAGFNFDTKGILNGNLGLLTISGAGTVRQQGTAAANLYVTTGAGAITINSTIADNTGALTLVKSGIGGTLTLSGANTYTGATVINAGLLATGSLANGGTASGIGQSTNDSATLVLNGGTLQYTGAAQATDRLFSVGLAGGTLDASGTGAVNFNNAGSVGFNGQTGARTLTLTGTNTGSNTLAAAIGDNAGATSLIKNGTGTWVLSATNTYGGSTFVNAGTLVADTTANATVLNTGSALVLGGGAFQLKGNTGNQSQILNGLTLAAGMSTVDVNNLGTSTTLDLSGTGGALGITRTTGTVDFKATTGTLGTTAIIKTAQTNDATGILGAWATVNGGADLAINNGSNVITAYTGYTDIDALGSTIADATAANVRLNTATGSGNVLLGATTTNINTLMQNTAAASTVDVAAKTLRVGTTGGILITPTGAALTVGTAANSGTLTAGGNATNTAGELILTNNSASALTINSVIANNGTGIVSLTKSGSGTAVLTGTNTNTGATTINSGTLQLGNGGTTGVLATAGTITNHGRLIFKRSNAVAQGTDFSTAAISGTGSVVQAGTGSLLLNAANTYSGGTIVKSGTLVGGTNTSSFGTGTITIGDASGSANASLSGAYTTYANAIVVAGGNTGTATLTTTNVNTTIFNGGVTLENHDLTIQGAWVGLTVGNMISGTGNIILTTPSNNITINGSVNNVGTITNTGTGSPSNGTNFNAALGSNVTGIIQDSATAGITFYGDNSAYTNGMTIKKGFIYGGGANSLGGAANIITVGDSTGSSSATLGAKGNYINAISIAAGNTGIATIAHTYQNAGSFSGLVTLNSHDVTLQSLGGVAANTLAFTGGFASTGTGGNIILSSLNTGVITISGGTINNVGTVTNSGVGTASNVISAVIGSNVTGVTQNSSTSALTLGGVNLYGGMTTVTLGTLATSATGTFGSSSVIVANGAKLTLGNSASFGDLATLTFASTSTASSINLNFLSSDTLGAVYDSITGTFLAAGTYTAGQLNTAFTSSVFAGTGSLTVSAVPEPATYAAIFGGLVLAGVVWRRRATRN